ncbi:MAG TPA: hypothetical protein ENH41_00660 [Candidatus Omnitrophica bacterium]|nr:hypothetical protein [Candidatus Omnitrophota bacterium]
MIVFDASTLILLAKLDILKTIVHTREVFISKEVKAEATCKSELLDAKIIIELINTGKIGVMKVKNQTLFKKFQDDFVLAEGEASALLLAQQKQAILATDDGQAIKACKVLGVKFVTAVHFLLDVFYKKRISKELALVKLERLEQLGRYNDRIIFDATSKIERRMGEK